VTSAGIWSLFEETYLRTRPDIQLADYSIFPEPRAPERRRIAATIVINGEERRVEGVGNGPIAAFVDALQRECDIELTSSTPRATRSVRGRMRQATAYVQVRDAGDATLYGVGIDGNIVTAL